MSITYHDLLSFSKDCLHRNDEIGYRNSISRAYYAAYHRVYPVMKNGPQDSHQGLIDYLANDSWRGNELFAKQDLVALSYMLKRLKDLRVISDYRLNDTIRGIDAQEAIKTSENVLEKIKSNFT